ncbi:MAG: MFS transporter [Candidatus Thermoplasmatota archaeon]|nr:MFS transporter [Candidatus Thermoplasmatota archaeon]
MQYKWVALSNTTIGVFMSAVNTTIILISIPAIFKGIHLDVFAPGSFVYLLWLLMGFNIITATLLVTFGRLSDIFGRVKLFVLGFAIFTFGSVLLFITPSTGTAGALELVIFRLVQGVGAAFLFANSSAIITDAFPISERGKALGINQVSLMSGAFIGLILGGILSVYDWRYVFLVSIPIGLLGTFWSLLKLKETSPRLLKQKIDYIGTVLFAGGLTLALIGLTYGIMPYNGNPTGWTSPFVIGSMLSGAMLLVIFPFAEKRIKQPMFNVSLFQNKDFSTGNMANLLNSVGRGGVMIVLIILLQGIWLPLVRGIPYSQTPLWAGIYMVPLTAGTLIMGPLAGIWSDRHGPKLLATLGMLLVAGAFLGLSFLPFDFGYVYFAIALFVMGIGNGMFVAPNTALIMNSVPVQSRGAASGMLSTLRNAGMTASTGIFFAIILSSLQASLPLQFFKSLKSIGAPTSVINAFMRTPPTISVFSAFLGENPVNEILASAGFNPPSSVGHVYSIISAIHWFPSVLAPAFMSSIDVAFYIGVAVSIAAAVFSYMTKTKTH